MKLEPRAEQMLTQIHTILTDEHVGLCVQVKQIHVGFYGDNNTKGLKARVDAVEPLAKEAHRAVYGGGWKSLRFQILLVWLAVMVLGTDNPFVKRLVDWWWK